HEPRADAFRSAVAVEHPEDADAASVRGGEPLAQVHEILRPDRDVDLRRRVAGDVAAVLPDRVQADAGQHLARRLENGQPPTSLLQVLDRLVELRPEPL